MQGKDFDIRISTKHRVRFTRNAFVPENRLLIDLLETNGHAKVIAFIDSGVAEAFPNLEGQVNDYLERMPPLYPRAPWCKPGARHAKVIPIP